MAYPTYFPYQSTQNYFQPQAQSFPQQMQQMPQAPQTGGCDLFVFTAEQPKQEEPVRYATLEDLEKLREELTRKAAANDAE